MKKLLGYWCLYVITEIGAYMVVGHYLSFGRIFLLELISTAIGVVVIIIQWQSLRLFITQVQKLDGVSTKIADKLALFIAGILLVVPGFITTIIGLLLLLPFVRKLILPMITAKGSNVIQTKFKVTTFGQQTTRKEKTFDYEEK